jgi:hypothetical protein
MMQRPNKFAARSMLFLILLVMFSAAQSFAQVRSFVEDEINDLGYDEGGEFNFVRVQFDTYYGRGYGYGPWSIDFPDADMNFLRGVSRLTNIRVMSDPIVLRFDDEKIFDYPFLYILEVGQGGGIISVLVKSKICESICSAEVFS